MHSLAIILGASVAAVGLLQLGASGEVAIGVGLAALLIGHLLARRGAHAPTDAASGRMSDSGVGAFGYGAAVCVVFFGALGVWSATAPLSSAALAPGVIRVSSNHLTVDHPTGGVIAALHVREGDAVRAGQPLIEFDASTLRAERRILSRRLDDLRVRQARLEAQSLGLEAPPLSPALEARADDDAELARLIDRERAVFAAAQAAERAEIDVRVETIRRLDERIAGIELRRAALVEEAAILDREIDSLTDLFDRGLTPQARMLELMRAAARLRASIADAETGMSDARAEIATTRREIVQIESARVAEATDALRSVDAELLEVAPQLDAVETQIAQSRMAAPADGVVFGLSEFAVGGSVRPGDPIMQIVPVGAPLVVEAQLRPVDRDAVFLGMEAEVRLAAFLNVDAPPLPARLVQISADIEVDPATQQSSYLAVLEVSNAALDAHGLRIEPGMPADAILPIAARTPAEYLVEPLLRFWSQALREE